MEKIEYILDKDCTLTRALSDYGFSMVIIEKLLKQKEVRVNGAKQNSNINCLSGDEITVFCAHKPTDRFDIIFEDNNIIVVNKYNGIEVMGSIGLEGKLHAFGVHRLDRNTTGLCVLAKNETAKILLDKAIKEKKFTKRYIAHCIGTTSYENFHFRAFLVKNEVKSLVTIYPHIVDNSVAIETIFNTISNDENSSIVSAELITGKTHQIRASLAYLHHAILGDDKYGKKELNKQYKINNQQLHAYYLKLDGLKNELKYLNNMEFELYPNWFTKK